MLCFDRTSPTMQTHWTAFFLCLSLPYTEAHVQYESGLRLLYDITLRATTTMILSTRGVTIPIDLVSSATDSIR